MNDLPLFAAFAASTVAGVGFLRLAWVIATKTPEQMEQILGVRCSYWSLNRLEGKAVRRTPGLGMVKARNTLIFNAQTDSLEVRTGPRGGPVTASRALDSRFDFE